MYSPKMGRWLSRDPLGESGGDNLYAYCQNDPINWDDPTGTDRVIAQWNANSQQFQLRIQPTKSVMVGAYPEFGYEERDDGPSYAAALLDNATGYAYLPGRGGGYLTMQQFQKAVHDGEDLGDPDWRAKHLIGKTAAETAGRGQLLLRGAVIVHDQQLAEVQTMIAKGEGNADEAAKIQAALTDQINSIFTGTSLAASLVEQLLFFYATAPLDLAQTVQVTKALQYADAVEYGADASRASNAANRAGEVLESATDTYRLANPTNYDRTARLKAFADVIKSRTQATVNIVDEVGWRVLEDGTRVRRFGTFDPTTNTITLYRGHNFGTETHELLHAWLFGKMSPAQKADVLNNIELWRRGLETEVEVNMAKLGFIGG